MRVVDKVISSICSASGLITFLLPEISIEWKFIICLAIALICFIYLYIVQLRTNKKIREQLKDVKKKHRAVSMQFKEKIDLIDHYKSSMDYLHILSQAVIFSSKKDRFEIFFNRFESTKNSLDKRSQQ